MNVTLQLQELDELIGQHTKPPATAILRNKLHSIREQVEAYQKGAEELAALKLSQAKESPEFISHMGVLWKKTRTGFEPNPYCAECPRPLVMTGNPPHRPLVWICSSGHRAPGNVTPPSA
jgi:hypothetical protein